MFCEKSGGGLLSLFGWTVDIFFTFLSATGIVPSDRK